MALKLIKNGYLRIFLGGALVAALTLFSGTTAFNGGGIEVIDSIFHGEDAPFMDFLYKMVFTLCISGFFHASFSFQSFNDVFFYSSIFLANFHK